jgi:hypothetical protein
LARNVSLSYDGDGDRGKPEKALTPLSLVVQKVFMPYSKDAGHHQTSIPILFFSLFFFPFHNSEYIDKKHQACKKYRKVNHGGQIGI